MKDQKSQQHFGKIAQIYRSLRITDVEPVREIARWAKKTGLAIMDVGCGTGRYTELLIAQLKPQICFCVDASLSMVNQAVRFLFPWAQKTALVFVSALAHALPAGDESLDLITSFNAVHHFPVKAFLKEAARALKPKGLLLIYTRTPQQNRRTIWGRCFPEFARKETRLLSPGEMRRLVQGVSGLELIEVKDFAYSRQAKLEELVNLAENHHYSTFSLYSSGQFARSLQGFVRNLLEKFPDPERIEFASENRLYVIQKSG